MEHESARRLVGSGRVNYAWLGEHGLDPCPESSVCALVHGESVPLTLHGVVPAHFSKVIAHPLSHLSSSCASWGSL